MLRKLTIPTRAVAALFQLAGMTLTSIGASIIHPAAGLITGGTLAVLFGIGLERGDA